MQDRLEVKFDYLSVTFPLIVMPDDNEQYIMNEILKMISTYLNINEQEIIKDSYATNRFKHQYNLGGEMILRLAGPVNELGYKTCQLELKGEGCREFERRNQEKTWKDFFVFLRKLNGNFKRIDIAVDDFIGDMIDMKWLFKKISKKYYTSIFKTPPKIIGTIETGMSITLGSHTSATELCIYDKLVEQFLKKKIKEREFWIRYELRFRGEKANTVVDELLLSYEDSSEEISGLALTDFACMKLRETIQIKEDNNYSIANQKNVKIDDLWDKFLGEISLAIYKSPVPRELSYESSLNYIMPKASLMLLFGYIRGGKDIDRWFYDIAKAVYRYTNKLTKLQLRRLNLFLDEIGEKAISEKDLEKIRLKMYKKVEEMEMPF